VSCDAADRSHASNHDMYQRTGKRTYAASDEREHEAGMFSDLWWDLEFEERSCETEEYNVDAEDNGLPVDFCISICPVCE
jgi:hypothetical protein